MEPRAGDGRRVPLRKVNIASDVLRHYETCNSSAIRPQELKFCDLSRVEQGFRGAASPWLQLRVQQSCCTHRGLIRPLNSKMSASADMACVAHTPSSMVGLIPCNDRRPASRRTFARVASLVSSVLATVECVHIDSEVVINVRCQSDVLHGMCHHVFSFDRDCCIR